jgi:hypothetical protein
VKKNKNNRNCFDCGAKGEERSSVGQVAVIFLFSILFD